MKLILHPGHGKCGSTSIQDYLLSRVDDLLSNGIVLAGQGFRPVKKPDDYDHLYKYFLAQLQGTEQDFRNEVEELVNQSEKLGHTILLSEEVLTDPRIFRADFSIHEILKSYFSEIQVIYYVRRQDDFLLSGWQEWWHKLGHSLEEEIESSLKVDRPQYLEFATELSNIYGNENVIVRPFNKNIFHDNDLIKDFCHYAGIPFKQMPVKNTPSNKGLNPYLCEILSMSSSKFYGNKVDNHKTRQWMNHCVSHPVLTARHPEYMTSDLRERIMDHFEKQNRKLHQEFFPEYTFESIFGTRNVGPKRELEGLREVLVAQMEIIYSLQHQVNLLKSKSRDTLYQRVKKLFK